MHIKEYLNRSPLCKWSIELAIIPLQKSEKEVPLSLLQATWDGRTDPSLKDYFSGFYVKYVKRQS